MIQKDEYLFVYGTLRSEFATPMYQFLVRHADFFDHGYFQGRLYEIDGYPGLVPSENTGELVYGEVYLLKNSEKIFKLIDNYEGLNPRWPEPHEYKRKQVEVSLIRGKKIMTWIYIYDLPVIDLYRIESGDYAIYINSKND